MALDFDKPPYDYSFKGSKAPKARPGKKAPAKQQPAVENEKNIVTYNETARPGQAFAPGDRGFLTDRMRDFSNFLGEIASDPFGPRKVVGGGYGDYLFGSNPVDQESGLLGKFMGEQPGRNERPEEDFTDRFRGGYGGGAGQSQMTLADALKQAAALIGSQGGVPSINYDPQRNEARTRATENDARLEAMYRQLRGSIDADAPKLQEAYQGALDSTRQNAADAQSQTQAATDSANSRNAQVLANLGIQQAQGNIVQQGNDLNTQTAQRMADQATKGQAASDRLVSNQATALQHNTNVGNAAGLEGNLQRSSNGARLQALLAELDMQEQQANQSAAAQNASLGRSDLGRQLDLAQWMVGNNTDEQRYQDSLQQQAAEQAAQGQQTLPDLDQFLQALAARGIEIPEDPRDLASLMDAARRYNF